MGQFYYSAKAFDVLERLDPNPEYWEGKRGACIGLFQQIIAGHEPRYVSYSVNHCRNSPGFCSSFGCSEFLGNVVHSYTMQLLSSVLYYFENILA